MLEEDAMVLRRLAVGGIGLALAAGLTLASLPFGAKHVAAAGGGACQLSGTANLTPGLTTSSQSFTYTFSGTLTCAGNASGSPAQLTGTVFAGTDPSGQRETTGFPSGTGSCGNSTTSGIAVAQFSDGSTAVLSYTTTGSGPAVALQGSSTASVAFGTNTYTTSAEWAGDQTAAGLTFSPASGQDCVTVPVTTAAINGGAVIGAA